MGRIQNTMAIPIYRVLPYPVIQAQWHHNYIIHCDALLHHPKRVPRLHLQRFGRWSLGTKLDLGALLWLLTAPTPRKTSITWLCLAVMAPALASARMRASLFRCVIARAMRGPYSRDKGAIWESTWPKSQRADTARVLPVALSYVASI